MREPLSPRDALHLAALRGCAARMKACGFRGKRRDSEARSYMCGAMTLAANLRPEQIDLTDVVDLIHERGFREVLTQLHVLEGRR